MQKFFLPVNRFYHAPVQSSPIPSGYENQRCSWPDISYIVLLPVSNRPHEYINLRHLKAPPDKDKGCFLPDPPPGAWRGWNCPAIHSGDPFLNDEKNNHNLRKTLIPLIRRLPGNFFPVQNQHQRKKLAGRIFSGRFVWLFPAIYQLL